MRDMIVMLVPHYIGPHLLGVSGPYTWGPQKTYWYNINRVFAENLGGLGLL